MKRPMLALATLAMIGCFGQSPLPSSTRIDSAGERGFVSPGSSGGIQRQRLAAAPADAPGIAPSMIDPLDRPSSVTMLIRTGRASIAVDSLDIAVSLIRDLAARVGGYVANVAIEAGTERLRSGTIEVKIPSVRFDEAMAGLKPIGKIESVTVEAQDVGEEFVDVTARMENARRLEQRLVDILASRTGKLKDVLDVEQALARVREEIERYEGRLRYLRAHVAVSTLAIYVHEPEPIVGPVGTSVMGEAFEQAWRNFVMLSAAGVQSLGVVIPLGLVGLAGWGAARRWRRKHPAPQPAQA